MYYVVDVESKEDLVRYLLNFIKFEIEQPPNDYTFVKNMWYDIAEDIRKLYNIERINEK